MRGDLDIDVVELLEALGIEDVKEGHREVSFKCPRVEHSFGNRPSAYMNKLRAPFPFYCHSCKWQGNVVSFVSFLENVSPMTASRWLREKYAPGYKEPGVGGMVGEWDSFFAAQAEVTSSPINTPLEQRHIDAFKCVSWDVVQRAVWEGTDVPEYLRYWIERGFSAQTLNDNELVYDPHTQRVCLTVRDDHGNIIGYKGRASDINDHPKYLVIGDRKGSRYGFAPYSTSKVVYGMHDVKLPVDGTIIVCEGELNAVMMRQHGYLNAVGISGSSLSVSQVDIIAYSASRCVLVFDSDDAGMQGLWGREQPDGSHAAGAVERLTKLVPTLVVPEHDGDPASMSAHAAKQLIESARSALLMLIPSPER